MKALAATLTKASGTFSENSIVEPEAGLIYDTLYREGEWVAGRTSGRDSAAAPGISKFAHLCRKILSAQFIPVTW